MQFTNAIVRRPGRSIVAGLSGGATTKPRYEEALKQHDHYIAALQKSGLEVTCLDAIEDYPDSTFVEDVAVLTPECAVLTAPGAASRKGEVAAIEAVLSGYYPCLERIDPPGTLDGGDILQIGRRVYIGLSRRTNPAGAQQLAGLLERYGMSAVTVPVEKCLHLKTGVTWLGGERLIATSPYLAHPAFHAYQVLPVADRESSAANCLAINDKILMPAGCPATRSVLERLGLDLIEVDISEFAKVDGGLSCLSLRF